MRWQQVILTDVAHAPSITRTGGTTGAYRLRAPLPPITKKDVNNYNQPGHQRVYDFHFKKICKATALKPNHVSSVWANDLE